MLKPEMLEAAIIATIKLSGHELNGQERLIVRSRVATTLAAKERHRQRIDAKPYQWQKPRAPRR